jgi:hypothetical protein
MPRFRHVSKVGLLVEASGFRRQERREREVQCATINDQRHRLAPAVWTISRPLDALRSSLPTQT